MNTQENFYKDALYPLQDEILGIIESLAPAFYLTGGTALSRGYLDHRYSDDLDFFSNAPIEFKKDADLCIRTIKSTPGFSMEPGYFSDSFASIEICKNNGKAKLKVDFVNDIAYYSGNLQKTKLFSRTDNPMNILINKIEACPKFKPKHIADILCICRAYSFGWEEIIGLAQQKYSSLNQIYLSKIIIEFPVDKFDEVKWTKNIDATQASSDLKKIAGDILMGAVNSLK